MSYDVVIPTSGRPSLAVLLAALGAADGPPPGRVVVVDDRPGEPGPLDVRVPGPLAGRTVVVRGPSRGPAAARNAGWRCCDAAWIAFLDDDVLPPPGWRAALAQDLDGLAPRVAGSQGRIHVPLRRDRRPTDWERNVGGLEHARWATADLAYRRSALAAVGGFDERFPRAYREDSDLGLRLEARGWTIVQGRRTVLHPVGDADAWVSLRKQQGNADDALMGALHGRDWRERAGAPQGRLPRHAATAAAGVAAMALAAGAALRRRRRAERRGLAPGGAECGLAPSRPAPADWGLAPSRRAPAALAAAAWAAGTAELAYVRIAPGPRTRDEVARMLLTSAAMPFAATAHRARGVLRARRLAALPGPRPERPAAVLFDRDGTLVHDVPYNGDPAKVRPVDGAREALDRLRAAGIPLAMVTNQSGIARGRITREQADAVNARVQELLGPFEHVAVCPHGPEDRCDCRKPAPGLLLEAARALGVPPARCAMVGDIGADVAAAAAAGARGVLVPTPVTRAHEVEAAPERASTLREAVDLLLAGEPAHVRPHAEPLDAHPVRRVAVVA